MNKYYGFKIKNRNIKLVIGARYYGYIVFEALRSARNHCQNYDLIDMLFHTTFSSKCQEYLERRI